MMNFETFTAFHCFEADEKQADEKQSARAKAEEIYKKRKKIIDRKREKIKKRFTTFVHGPSIYS